MRSYFENDTTLLLARAASLEAWILRAKDDYIFIIGTMLIIILL